MTLEAEIGKLAKRLFANVWQPRAPVRCAHNIGVRSDLLGMVLRPDCSLKVAIRDIT